MYLTLKKETEEQVEIDLPLFVNLIGPSMVTENGVVSVQDNGNTLKLYEPHMIECFVSKGQPIEKSVFDNAFQTSLSKLNALDACAIPKATPEEIAMNEEDMYQWEEYNRQRQDDGYDPSI
jgi:hypothetical protein